MPAPAFPPLPAASAPAASPTHPKSDDQWVSTTSSAAIFQTPGLVGGTVLQVLTTDPNGVCDGTAYFVVTGAYPPDGHGRFLEVHFGGASQLTHVQQMVQAFGFAAGQNL